MKISIVKLNKIAFIAALIPAISFAQLFPVAPIEKGFFSSSDPTMTFVYEAKNPKATLVFIPGGEGSVGVKENWNKFSGYFSNYYYNTMLQGLTDPSKTSGSFNVVIFDSPKSLGTSDPSARSSSSHLSRIESVVLFYKEKYHKPVWVMGHSNGGISVTAFYKYLQKNKKDNMVSGLVYSAGRNASWLNDETKLPVLLMHHEKDGCSATEVSNTEKIFRKLQESGNSNTELVLIKSGMSMAKDPCHSGYHMYYAADEEVLKAMDQFMTKYTPSL